MPGNPNTSNNLIHLPTSSETPHENPAARVALLMLFLFHLEISLFKSLIYKPNDHHNLLIH